MIYISFWPEFQGGPEYPIRNLKFSLWQHIQLYLCFSHITGIWKIGSLPIRIIYMSFLLNFQGDSESELINLKFIQWQHVWLYYIIASFGRNTIFTNQDVLYHPDQNFHRILNIQPEILNLACGNKYSYICIMCFSHTATLRDIWPSPIRMIHISSWLKSQGESESGLRNLKFSLWQHVQLYLYISHIMGRFDFHQTRWTIHHPKPIFEENLDLKSEFQNSTNSIHIWHITVLVNTCMLYYAISRNPTVRIICLTYRWYMFTHW
jgi:hypothetical protein